MYCIYMSMNFILLSPKSQLYFALLKQRSAPAFPVTRDVQFLLLLIACHDVLCDIIMDLEGSGRHRPRTLKFIFYHDATAGD